MCVQNKIDTIFIRHQTSEFWICLVKLLLFHSDQFGPMFYIYLSYNLSMNNINSCAQIFIQNTHFNNQHSIQEEPSSTKLDYHNSELNKYYAIYNIHLQTKKWKLKTERNSWLASIQHPSWMDLYVYSIPFLFA